MANESMITKDYIVAFIDILGATRMIEEDQNKSLEIVHNAYDSAWKIYKEIFKKKTRFDFKFFSDNVVIAIQVKKEENIRSYFSYMSVMASLIQLNFLMRDILVRGGIALGGYYSDDLMIWGKGLIKAYELENTIAIYPRIVVDPELIGKMELFTDEKIDLSDYGLIQDIDGICYLDFFQKKIIQNRPDFLLKEMEDMDKRLEGTKKLKILQKHNWHQNYIISKLKDLYLDEYS